jgi:integrase
VHIVASRLGHSSPVVTLTTYAHVLPTGDEQAADVMADVLR